MKGVGACAPMPLLAPVNSFADVDGSMLIFQGGQYYEYVNPHGCGTNQPRRAVL